MASGAGRHNPKFVTGAPFASESLASIEAQKKRVIPAGGARQRSVEPGSPASAGPKRWEIPALRFATAGMTTQ